MISPGGGRGSMSALLLPVVFICIVFLALGDGGHYRFVVDTEVLNYVVTNTLKVWIPFTLLTILGVWIWKHR